MPGGEQGARGCQRGAEPRNQGAELRCGAVQPFLSAGWGEMAPGCNVKAWVIQVVVRSEDKQRAIPAGPGFRAALDGEDKSCLGSWS